MKAWLLFRDATAREVPDGGPCVACVYAQRHVNMHAGDVAFVESADGAMCESFTREDAAREIGEHGSN